MIINFHNLILHFSTVLEKNVVALRVEIWRCVWRINGRVESHGIGTCIATNNKNWSSCWVAVQPKPTVWKKLLTHNATMKKLHQLFIWFLMAEEPCTPDSDARQPDNPHLWSFIFRIWTSHRQYPKLTQPKETTIIMFHTSNIISFFSVTIFGKMYILYFIKPSSNIVKNRELGCKQI